MSHSRQNGVRTSRARLAIVTAEAGLILTLLAVWFLSEEARAGRSLTVLFFYCFPSEFLIGLLPHEPLLLLYGATYTAFTVALISAVGTAFAEGLNYSFLGFFYDVGWFDRVRGRPVVARLIRLFERAPFLAILVAGFTPIPFFPVRFLAVITGYPVLRYLLGVFISRAPRFYLLALLGGVIHFPVWALLGIFATMILALHLPALRGLRGPAQAAVRGRPVPPIPSR